MHSVTVQDAKLQVKLNECWQPGEGVLKIPVAESGKDLTLLSSAIH